MAAAVEDLNVRVTMRFGYARMQERWVQRGDGAWGIESRTDWYSPDGVPEEIGEWRPPLAWLVTR